MGEGKERVGLRQGADSITDFFIVDFIFPVPGYSRVGRIVDRQESK